VLHDGAQQSVMKAYQLIAGSAAAQFHESKAKIKIYGGGFANGKTTALVAEALKLARDYPGSSGMLGRATYANLEKTLMREFFKWCPKTWVKSFNKNSGTCVLHNETTIDFRYIANREGGDAEGSSNLLSANYDWIMIDQIEEPEISQHDFDHLMGRLRGQTEYIGDDDSMPRTGPRQLVLSCNPALGWFYKNVVKPLKDFQQGIDNPLLLCEKDPQGNRLLDANGRPIPIVELFEATTFDNAQNLQADYLTGLLATYSGKMRDRYIYGKWVAFEGVIYGDVFDSNTHVVPHQFLLDHIRGLRTSGYQLQLLEGYDFGIAEPSCYLQSLVDADGIVYIIDGFYEREAGISWQADQIKKLREQNAAPEMLQRVLEPVIKADPAIFKRSNAGAATVGDTTATLFMNEGIIMDRGNNNIMNGIIKVKSYMRIEQSKVNPFNHGLGCPKLFISDKLHWLIDEIETWRWRKAKDDSAEDKPVDGNDHGVDTLKYMLSEPPRIGKLVGRRGFDVRKVSQWVERDTPAIPRSNHRYGVH
jgi:hypothetical protein